ncbi:bifunctional adenosylcobinamide kinase/adenosylcobinamide-phosphate guanylyltransferase [Marinobacter sp. 1-3A]|uniref:bifunctional adenosylcobinamide kinase/adenosylcobinamide-phosphate guanylyltransferase n=1 Tax=unclassified Marinobacter TaxID=83889 RepID=UPI0019059B61|nr:MULTISPECIES: bifunctional adenosylcobinamide kinase/adenosylcobinamide-phosphate guanylyltransferase [unclassified Marinobacter]MBK1872352.1 bifunctional adenosylcobinamide kinase/adenosylcobinamide-phosphate guanylyltransferase [Marinobacter sp. 1-3A]MBK1887233.1 bifunctional adenosylcobinamide kinase/adenosylcobinamide-phosphate guanylyltransferase [Marinobacter sp. DY40_1A1]
MHTLVLGGIRSGKTALAERLASGTNNSVVYLATATAGDDEMRTRIQRHQQQRPDGWGLEEETLALAQVLARQGKTTHAPCILIDCMSLWVSNLLHAGEEIFDREREAFLNQVSLYPGELVIVSNEVGLGTIGMDPLTRRFADELGWLNQALAAVSDKVVMSVAGLPMVLKP